MIRGARDDLSWPNWLLVVVTFGFSGRKLLGTLNASALNSNDWLSRNVKILDKAISKSQVEGPTTL